MLKSWMWMAVLGFSGSMSLPPSSAPAYQPADVQMMTTQPSEWSPAKSYVCPRTTVPMVIDGKADEAVWAAIPWTDDFIDIEGDKRPKPYYRTRAKICWDDQYIYFYAELEEPHVWGTLTKRNSIIFHDNDFEIFIDPDRDRLRYYEFEINALGTVLELSLDKPYVDQGNYTFKEMDGLKTAVQVKGTINDPTDKDQGWTVEVAIPFAGLGKIADGVKGTPKVGEVWWLNFSRVQWRHEIVDGKYVKVPKETKAEENWVWSEMGVIDMHRPERWGRLVFGGVPK